MDARTDDQRNPGRRYELRFARDSLIRAGEEPPLGSHLVTPRMLYNHHGVYVGNGRVIHYAGLAHGIAVRTSARRFAHGHGIRLRQDLPRFNRPEVMERARSRLGECSYRILTNNCEHLCAWALRDSCARPIGRDATPIRLWLRDLHRQPWPSRPTPRY